MREMRRLPEGLLADILEARGFAATWRQWDGAEKKTDVPSSPLLDRVIEIEMAVQAELLAARSRT